MASLHQCITEMNTVGSCGKNIWCCVQAKVVTNTSKSKTEIASLYLLKQHKSVTEMDRTVIINIKIEICLGSAIQGLFPDVVTFHKGVEEIRPHFSLLHYCIWVPNVFRIPWEPLTILPVLIC